MVTLFCFCRVGGRSTPDASGRHIPECYGRVTPEYFGRLTPDHSTPGRRASEPKFRNVRVGALFNKWRNVWLVSIERHRRLQDTLDKLDEVGPVGFMCLLCGCGSVVRWRWVLRVTLWKV